VSERRDFRSSRLLSSPNKLKLAAFGFNSQGGSTITKAPGTADTDWGFQVRVAQLAERAGIEALIPGARWKGYGGETNFQGRSYETLTWAAGLAGVTHIAQVFATVHVTTIPPIRLAKTLATIDHIANGRLGVNWVAGWNRDENGMFGGDQREHDDRYAFAEDFLNVMQRIMDTDEEFDYKSPFFDLKGLYSQPKTIQIPRPVYMAAGLSPRGRQFAASHADVLFTVTHVGPEAMGKQIEETKAIARGFGREVIVFGQAVIVCADSEAEARDYFNYYVHEQGDWEAADHLLTSLFSETRDAAGNLRGTLPPHVRRGMMQSMISGHGGVVLLGTPTQVVEQIKTYSDHGMDGTTLSWVNFEQGLVQFREKILPIMIQAGLREDESATATTLTANAAE
jgi:FMNH2-dependent dimethyl sulfone monooxygenase